MDSFEVKLSESEVGALNTERDLVGFISKCWVTQNIVGTFSENWNKKGRVPEISLQTRDSHEMRRTADYRYMNIIFV